MIHYFLFKDEISSDVLPEDDVVPPTNNMKHSFSDIERKAIISDCTDQLISPKSLAKTHNVRACVIRSWIKNDGQDLPEKFEKISLEKRNSIVKQCTEDLISPPELAKIHQISDRTIRNWVKESGSKLPSKYATSSASNANVSTVFIFIDRPLKVH